MQEHYQTKVMTPKSSSSEPCRECGGSGEVEERIPSPKGTVIRHHRCPLCGTTAKGYRIK